MISASVTFFSAFQLLLVEPSQSLLPWRHQGVGLPHAVHSFSGCAPASDPGKTISLSVGLLPEGMRGPTSRWSAPSPNRRRGKAVPGHGLQEDKQSEHDFLQWGFDLPNVTRQAGDKRQALCDSWFPQEMLCVGIHTGRFLAGPALGLCPSQTQRGN